MRFAIPYLLLLIPVAVALVLLLLRAAESRRTRFLAEYAETPLLERMGTPLSTSPYAGRAILLGAVVTLLVAAAARPQWGHTDITLRGRGVDVMVAVDVSASMLARDYQPNRLARARQLLQDVIWQTRGDRIGVLAFAGDAAILCPLTLDHRMARVALDSVTPNTIRTRGTDISRAIEVATKAFQESSSGERILVLLTDGEDHGGRLNEVLDRAARAGVRIFAIGIGTTEGRPIPTQDGYLEDREGRVVTTRLDLDALTRAATKTGGRAVKANPAGDAEVRTIIGDIATRQAAGREEQTIRVHHERHPWLILPAIFLLILDSLIIAGWRPRSPFAPRRTLPVAASLLLALICLPQSAPAILPGQATRENNKGISAWDRSNYNEAADRFNKAVQADPADARLRLNEATARRAAGETTAARDLFLSVYDRQNPAVNAAARYNLGTADHKDLMDDLRQALRGPGLVDVPEDQRAELKQQLQSLRDRLTDSARRYREALIQQPADALARQNLELALRQRQELDRLLIEPPPSTPPPSPSPSPSPTPQPDNQDQPPPQDQNPQQDPPQPSDTNQSGQDGDRSDQPQPDATPTPTPGPSPTPSPGPSPNPTPTPAPSPSPGSQDQAGQSDKNPSEPQDADSGEPEDKPGQMTDRDVERLLNSLPEEDRRALQRFLTGDASDRPDMEKPW